MGLSLKWKTSQIIKKKGEEEEGGGGRKRRRREGGGDECRNGCAWLRLPGGVDMCGNIQSRKDPELSLIHI